MRRSSFLLLPLALVIALPVTSAKPAGRQAGSKSSPGLDEVRLGRIEELVTEAVKAKGLPGAVVMVGRGGRVLYLKAFGNRALEPKIEPMTIDTVFDLASVTKVVATTTSVMVLVEEGRVRSSDRVAAFIPGFERYGKGDITVRHLLTHLSGLRPDLDMTLEFSGSKVAIERAIEEVPIAPPGEALLYSDINFFLLQKSSRGERDGPRPFREGPASSSRSACARRCSRRPQRCAAGLLRPSPARRWTGPARART
jgi:CubicO group peptidase (beta-lactamase class C family)